MKKGFTLIELLIVMVIVATLVSVAVPKYRLSMERSRALEGIAWANAIGEYLNARYVIDGKYEEAKIPNYITSVDRMKATYFGSFSSSSGDDGVITVSLPRIGSSNFSYSIIVQVSNGDTKTLCCYGNEKLCSSLGGDESGNCKIGKEIL